MAVLMMSITLKSRRLKATVIEIGENGAWGASPEGLGFSLPVSSSLGRLKPALRSAYLRRGAVGVAGDGEPAVGVVPQALGAEGVGFGPRRRAESLLLGLPRLEPAGDLGEGWLARLAGRPARGEGLGRGRFVDRILMRR